MNYSCMHTSAQMPFKGKLTRLNIECGIVLLPLYALCFHYVQTFGDDSWSILTLTAFSQSSLPARPSLSVNVTSRNAMSLHGVYEVHLNSATVVLRPGRTLSWLELPQIRAKVMLVNRVLVLPAACLHGNGQSETAHERR